MTSTRSSIEVLVAWTASSTVVNVPRHVARRQAARSSAVSPFLGRIRRSASGRWPQRTGRTTSSPAHGHLQRPPVPAPSARVFVTAWSWSPIPRRPGPSARRRVRRPAAPASLVSRISACPSGIMKATSSAWSTTRPPSSSRTSATTTGSSPPSAAPSAARRHAGPGRARRGGVRDQARLGLRGARRESVAARASCIVA